MTGAQLPRRRNESPLRGQLDLDPAALEEDGVMPDSLQTHPPAARRERDVEDHRSLRLHSDRFTETAAKPRLPSRSFPIS